MAKNKPQPAPRASDPSKPAPYPSNWARMKPEERQSWLQANRPGRPAGPVGPAAPAPAPTSSAVPPEGAVPVKLRVLLWKVQVGERGPVECGTAELGEVLAQEMRAYEDEQGNAGAIEEDGAEDDDEF